jgi:hypothetical protein
MYAVCCAWSSSIDVRFTEPPFCENPIGKQLGKPWLEKPCNVFMPLLQ